MKQTAMQELKSDLILTKEITLNSFSAIKKQEIKDACIKVVEMTLNSIITRIDTELLEMEKEQMNKNTNFICHSCGTKHTGENDDQMYEVCKQCFINL